MPGTARSSSENRQIGGAKSRFRITIFHLPSRIESAASTLLALSNSNGVALRSEDSTISSVTNKSVRILIAHPILSLRSSFRIIRVVGFDTGGCRYGWSPAALVVWVAQLLKRALQRAIR